jgi:glycosyltransferase involved in cell wall biosynthesis
MSLIQDIPVLTSPTVSEQPRKKLLTIANSFSPATTPTSNRSTKLLKHLKSNWDIQVVTATPSSRLEGVPVHVVQSWFPGGLLQWMNKLKLEKFVQLLVFPDDTIFWVVPAFLKGLKVIRQEKSEVIVVFMMPYSAGLVGILLKWMTGLPLVLNLDDSLTCTDMHPFFSTRLHYQMSRWLEDFYVRQADEIVYVSQFNLEEVRQRQPIAQRSKFNLVRYGADAEDFNRQQEVTAQQKSEDFSIVYIGGMNGWYHFCNRIEETSTFKRIYQWWMKLGQYELSKVDFRTSSPMYVGHAVKAAIARNLPWNDRIKVNVYGNNFPDSVVNTALGNEQLTEVVSVSGSIPNTQAIQVACEADLLFMTLPKRMDGSAGGRISAKTYEYLMSDRPILAALPQGENWNYLEGQPGVYLVEPDDVAGMAEVISQLATRKFLGDSLSVDRADLQQQLSYRKRSTEFSQVLDSALLTKV